MNAFYRIQNYGIGMDAKEITLWPSIFKANYPRLKKPYLVLKDRSLHNESSQHFEALTLRILSLQPLLDGGEIDDTILLRHRKTSKFPKVKKRKSGRKTENEGRKVPDRRPAAEAAIHFLVSDIYLPL